MNKKICFAIPTYPGHYLYALDFINSYKKYGYDRQSDLIFIFTSSEERDGFISCQSLVLPKSLRNMKNKGIINIKKFYALMQLKNLYDYIIVLDDDCVFIGAADILSVCETYFKNKKLFGNFLNNSPFEIQNSIVENCKRFFKGDENKIDSGLYLWFNQLPIYKTSHLSEFFNMTKICKNINNLTWYDFDYYIYMYYLILAHDFQVYDTGVEAGLSVAEITPSIYFEIYSEVKRSVFYMATEYAKNYFNMENVFLQIHNDRENAKMKKGSISKAIGYLKIIHKIKQIL